MRTNLSKLYLRHYLFFFLWFSRSKYSFLNRNSNKGWLNNSKEFFCLIKLLLSSNINVKCIRSRLNSNKIWILINLWSFKVGPILKFILNWNDITSAHFVHYSSTIFKCILQMYIKQWNDKFNFITWWNFNNKDSSL